MKTRRIQLNNTIELECFRPLFTVFDCAIKMHEGSAGALFSINFALIRFIVSVQVSQESSLKTPHRTNYISWSSLPSMWVHKVFIGYTNTKT